jgi:hypothetical protein
MTNVVIYLALRLSVNLLGSASKLLRDAVWFLRGRLFCLNAVFILPERFFHFALTLFSFSSH